MGPPGAGKSFLGRTLAERGIVSYREVEPLLRQRFGSGREFEARIREAGLLLWRSYRDQLDRSERIVAFESAGIADRPLLERLQREYRVALVRVHADRSLCVERVACRAPEDNISPTTDRGAIGRHYDLWQERILPTYRFALVVDGGSTERAVTAIRSFLLAAG